MIEKFDDGTSVNRTPAGLHYSEKGGHWWRGLFKRMQGERIGLFVRVETSWHRRRNMRRISQDGRR